MKVHVVAILDMSGSMSPLAEDVRGGFNKFIEGIREDAKSDGTDNYVSLTCFDTEFLQVWNDKPLTECKPITPKEYTPRGMTALYDAVGKTISNFQMRTIGPDEKVLVLITTDGHENSSQEWDANRVKQLVEELQAKPNWDFMYLHAQPGGWDQASQQAAAMGVAPGQTVTTGVGSGATASTYNTMRGARMSATQGQTVSSYTEDASKWDWSAIKELDDTDPKKARLLKMKQELERKS